MTLSHLCYTAPLFEACRVPSAPTEQLNNNISIKSALNIQNDKIRINTTTESFSKSKLMKSRNKLN